MTIPSEWEHRFTQWAKSPPPTEQTRCDNTIRAIRTAIAASDALNHRGIHVFTQGSFRNRVNVRQDSDVDVGVMLHDSFFPSYGQGVSASDFNFIDATYPYQQFKDDLEAALVAHFGRRAVHRGRKAFDISERSTYHVDADVVPFLEHRHYWSQANVAYGVALKPDGGGSVIHNYPERLLDYWPDRSLHYENGVSKNTATGRRYKSVVRIMKKLSNVMADNDIQEAEAVPSFLIECLVWNTPNDRIGHSTWIENVAGVLKYLWSNTETDAGCSEWCEVNNIKILFHVSQPWTRDQVRAFIKSAWNYVGVFE